MVVASNLSSINIVLKVIMSQHASLFQRKCISHTADFTEHQNIFGGQKSRLVYEHHNINDQKNNNKLNPLSWIL